MISENDAMLILLTALKDWKTNTTDVVDDVTTVTMLKWIQVKQIQAYREGMTPQQWWYATYNALQWDNPPPCPV